MDSIKIGTSSYLSVCLRIFARLHICLKLELHFSLFSFLDTGFVCDCAKGYIGAKCQTFNSCSSNPCQNFGTCHLIGKSYSCNCSQGYVLDRN